MSRAFVQALETLFQPLIAAGKALDATSLRLYVILVLTANAHGLAVRSRMKLAEALDVSETEIDRALRRLVDTKLVKVLSPSPYLAITLRSWPGKQAKASVYKSTAAAGSTASAEAADATQSKHSSKQGDEGLGEGGSLASELTAVLGEADAQSIEPALQDLPEAVVREAIRRVRATPAHQIKKSRTALFRFLLKKLTRNTL